PRPAAGPTGRSPRQPLTAYYRCRYDRRRCEHVVSTPPTPPGGFPGMPDPNDPAQMQAFLAQMQQMFAAAGTADGPVNWALAQQIAEQVARPTDRSLTAAERTSTTDALRLADVWLD